MTSVIVLNYNGRPHLERCLAAVARQDDSLWEAILVDNASVDGSVAYVQERFPFVRVVALDHNAGFAAGNNAGARIAAGRHLAFLNNDTEADAGWLRALRGALDRHPEAGLATSRIVFMRDRSLVDSAGDGFTRSGGAFKRGHGGPVTGVLESREVFGACGAAFMIRREVFDELGGFDEDFFVSHEDVDLSYRAQLHGYRCLYVADAVVAHAGSATLGPVSRQWVFYGQRNLEWVYFKNTPWPLLVRTLPSHALYNAAAGLYFASIGLARPFLAGKLAAVRGARHVWRKRRALQSRRRATLGELWRLLEPRWLRTKLREERFDLDLARSS